MKLNFLYFVIIYPFIAIFIGSRMRALGNIIHECSHNSFASTRKRNRIIGQFISIVLFECFDSYKKEHMLHHRFLGHELYDVDYIKYKNIKLNLFNNNKYNVLFSILNPIHWYISLKNISVFYAKTQSIRNLKKIYFFLLIVCFYFWPKEVFLYFIFPYMTTYQMFKLFSDIIDHDMVYESPSIDDRAHNHIFSWKILNWLFFPRNDAYHLVHHLYPSLPISEYQTRHANLLKKNSVYAAKNHSCSLQKVLHSGIQN